MRTVKIAILLVAWVMAFSLTGCISEQEHKDLKLQNATQQKRIAELESQLQTAKLQLDKLQRELDAAQGRGGVETSALLQKIAALEEDINAKKALIEAMQRQLVGGGVQLPVELSSMLEDFAREKSDMVTFDPATGIVKFKSDLLFDPGSDNVASSAVEAVKSLCEILNSEQGQQFDIIIAGHTDDIKIGKPETRQKHPTNWHLSAHRAISVLNIMNANKVDQTRMSVRGFGEFRPIEANEPNQKGNPQNRRVEIYIVPKGA